MSIADCWELKNDFIAHLKMTENIAERKLRDKVDKYFTDHSIWHSYRIIDLIKEWLKGKMSSLDNHLLTPEEVYILFSAAYLHDIGMQCEKAGGKPETRRAIHEQIGANEVRNNPEEYLIISDYASYVAKIMEGHRATKEELSSSKYDDALVGTARPPLKIRFLSALLQMADELDVSYQRVNPSRDKLLEMPLKGQMHYYKHYYVQSVNVSDGQITITFRFPIGKLKEYEWLFKKLILEKIDEKWKDLFGIFNEQNVHFCPSPNHPSNELTLDEMPPEVFSYICKQLCNLKNFKVIDEEFIKNQKKQEADPELFYKGSVSWADVISNFNAKRNKDDGVFQDALKLGADSMGRAQPRFLLITAEAGAGKTTLLFQIGYDLYKEYKDKKEFWILYLKRNGIFDADQVRGFHLRTGKPLYILVDVIGAKAVVKSLRTALSIFSDNHTPATIIAVARKNEWENAEGNSLNYHLPCPYNEWEMQKELTNQEMEDVLKLLEKHDSNGNLLGRLGNLNRGRKSNSLLP